MLFLDFGGFDVFLFLWGIGGIEWLVIFDVILLGFCGSGGSGGGGLWCLLVWKFFLFMLICGGGGGFFLIIGELVLLFFIGFIDFLILDELGFVYILF